MKQFIDFETWERKNSFEHFSTFQCPDYSVTVQMRCGNAKENAKQEGQSFFIYCLYAMLRAANEIAEFRYRKENGRVVIYDRLDVVTTVAVGDDGRFVGVRIPYQEDFSTFYAGAYQIIKDAPNRDDVHHKASTSGESVDFGLILLSVLPGLHFTAMTSTQMTQGGSLYPLLSVGKMIQQEGENHLPVAITVNHSFIDGYHLTEFFKKAELYLQTIW